MGDLLERRELSRRSGLWLALAALTACSEVPPLLPADAPGMARTRRYEFGDTTAGEHQRATFAILDQLEPRFGKPLRNFARVLDANADPRAIEAHYLTQLGPLGWKALPLTAALRNAWAFALESPKGGYVLAVVALRVSRSTNNLVPAAIVTNLDDDGRPGTR